VEAHVGQIRRQGHKMWQFTAGRCEKVFVDVCLLHLTFHSAFLQVESEKNNTARLMCPVFKASPHVVVKIFTSEYEKKNSGGRAWRDVLQSSQCETQPRNVRIAKLRRDVSNSRAPNENFRALQTQRQGVGRKRIWVNSHNWYVPLHSPSGESSVSEDGYLVLVRSQQLMNTHTHTFLNFWESLQTFLHLQQYHLAILATTGQRLLSNRGTYPYMTHTHPVCIFSPFSPALPHQSPFS